MIRRPPRSTLSSSSAASDVYKRQIMARRCYFAGLAGGRRVVGGTMPVETASFGFLAALGLRVSRPPLFFPPIARLLASPRTVCTATTLRPRPGGLLDGTARAGRGKALWSTRRTAERSARDDGSDLRVVLQPREPGGEAFDRDLELRVQVEEVAQSLGQPLQRDRLAATPLGELLQSPVGEVHRQRYRANAASRSATCSASCIRLEPAAGLADGRRATRRSRRSSGRKSGRLMAMCVQAPMLAGSSCTQTTSCASG